MTCGVQLLFYAIVLIAPTCPFNLIKSTNVIADFLQKFISPYLESVRAEHLPINNTKTDEKVSKVLNAIKEKVTELKPYLQDTDVILDTDDKLTLRGNEETTLIEFLPKLMRSNNRTDKTMKNNEKDPLKLSIKKYKVLREKIKTKLDKENITEGTKKLIINTLDDMIAQMIESQCIWTSHRRLLQGNNDTSYSISKLNSMTKKQWKNLKQKYLEYLKNRKKKEDVFMNQFHQFFSNVIHNTDNLSDRYKIQCEVVEVNKDKNKHLALREKKPFKKGTCDTFQICSDELKEFFHDFYHYVNDTAVSVFKNYASMYERDVNIDYGVNRHVVMDIINNLGDTAEEKVHDIYKKEINKFYLDPDKAQNANMNFINNFIRTIIKKAKALLKADLVSEMTMMRSKLFLTVKEDILVNLQVDMDNLERHYIDTVCATFVLCNGRLPSRRLEGPWTFRPKANNEVFVKVQLSFDDELKNAVAKSGVLPFLKDSNVKFKIARNRKSLHRAGPYSFATVNITRTTLIVSNVTTTREKNIVDNNNNETNTPLISTRTTRYILTNATQLFSGLNSSNENEIIVT